MKDFVSSLKPCKRWGWEENLYIKAQDLSITPSASLILYLIEFYYRLYRTSLHTVKV